VNELRLPPRTSFRTARRAGGRRRRIRLRERYDDRVTTHLSSRVEDLLPKFGKAALLTDQIDMLTALRRLAAPPEVAALLDMFDRHRRGLEQEALLM